VGVHKAITMLIIACPIALVLATPTAMVAALSCAARLGILIKNVACRAVRMTDRIKCFDPGLLSSSYLQSWVVRGV
jgi:Cd2+/Zn2+-exporting ATPase